MLRGEGVWRRNNACISVQALQRKKLFGLQLPLCYSVKNINPLLAIFSRILSP